MADPVSLVTMLVTAAGGGGALTVAVTRGFRAYEARLRRASELDEARLKHNVALDEAARSSELTREKVILDLVSAIRKEDREERAAILERFDKSFDRLASAMKDLAAAWASHEASGAGLTDWVKRFHNSFDTHASADTAAAARIEQRLTQLDRLEQRLDGLFRHVETVGRNSRHDMRTLLMRILVELKAEMNPDELEELAAATQNTASLPPTTENAPAR